MAKGQKTGGRQKGTPNKVTGEIRARIEEGADPIGVLNKIAAGEWMPDKSREGEEDADSGEYPTIDQRLQAAKWLGAKLIPDAKERAIQFEVGELSGPSDALAAMSRAINAMGDGEMTIGEAKAACDVIGVYLKAYEMDEFEKRLAALEGQ